MKKMYPTESKVITKKTADGDNIIDSVTYKTNKGEDRTVKFVYSLDGDRIPETGFTLDGDFNFPNQRYDF